MAMSLMCSLLAHPVLSTFLQYTRRRPTEYTARDERSTNYYAPVRGAEYCGEHIFSHLSRGSASISSEPLVRTSPNFLRVLPMAVARPVSGGVAICYVGLRPVCERHFCTKWLAMKKACSNWLTGGNTGPGRFLICTIVLLRKLSRTSLRVWLMQAFSGIVHSVFRSRVKSAEPTRIWLRYFIIMPYIYGTCVFFLNFLVMCCPGSVIAITAMADWTENLHEKRWFGDKQIQLKPDSYYILNVFCVRRDRYERSSQFCNRWSKGVLTLYVPLFTLECDVICTSLWGCGRRRAAPAKSLVKQRTERWFILILLR